MSGKRTLQIIQLIAGLTMATCAGLAGYKAAGVPLGLHAGLSVTAWCVLLPAAILQYLQAGAGKAQARAGHGVLAASAAMLQVAALIALAWHKYAHGAAFFPPHTLHGWAGAMLVLAMATQASVGAMKLWSVQTSMPAPVQTFARKHGALGRPLVLAVCVIAGLGMVTPARMAAPSEWVPFSLAAAVIVTAVSVKSAGSGAGATAAGGAVPLDAVAVPLPAVLSVGSSPTHEYHTGILSSQAGSEQSVSSRKANSAARAAGEGHDSDVEDTPLLRG